MQHKHTHHFASLAMAAANVIDGIQSIFQAYLYLLENIRKYALMQAKKNPR
jgi:hypothetical protein